MNNKKGNSTEHGVRLHTGFSLIEILIVVSIVGVLAAILIPALNRALSSAHINRTVADLKQLKGLVADGANQLGGTLPLTKGYASTGSIVNSTSSPNLGGSAVADLNGALRLDEVLLSVPSPKLEKYFAPACGSQTFLPTGGSDLADPRYNSSTGTFYNLPDAKIPAGYSYANVSRLECCAVDLTQAPGSIDTSGGTNFKIDGVNALTVGRVAYAVIKAVPGPEAFAIASAINTPSFMDDSSGSAATAQVRGQVAYLAATGGVTDVYVYLGNY